MRRQRPKRTTGDALLAAGGPPALRLLVKLRAAELGELLGLLDAQAQAEGSVTGHRVRQFTANELVALARTFDLPVLYFFLPPEDRSGELRTPDAGDMP